MVEPWLTIIGVGENALTDLSDASLSLISEADYIFGGKRHLELVNAKSKGIVWPVPFSINELLPSPNCHSNKLASKLDKFAKSAIKENFQPRYRCL